MSPPTIQTGTKIVQTYRFRNTSATSQGISVGAVLAACGAVASATGSAGSIELLPFATSMRVKRVRMWGAVNNLGNTSQVSTSFATVSVDFDTDASNGGNPGLQFTDSTMSNARLAFLEVVPPPNCFARFWHSQVEAAETLFITNCALGSIMDLDVEWILNDDDGVAGIGGIVNTVAATKGHVYYPAPGSGNWVPNGRVTNGTYA